MQIDVNGKSLICIWCGKSTTGNKEVDHLEHVFPQSIGGVEVLYTGAVCYDCQNSLSEFDKSLRYDHPLMQYAFQIDWDIYGKKYSGKRKKTKDARVAKERESISGAAGEVSRDAKKATISLIDNNILTENIGFMRGLHNCAANLLCREKDSAFVRDKCPELINLVKTGVGTGWSYGVSIFPSEPFLEYHPKFTIPEVLFWASTKDDQYIFSFIHTSGIWLVGTHPGIIAKDTIAKFSEKLFNDDPVILSIRKTYGDIFGKDFRYYDYKDKAIGNIKFLWSKDKKW
jgi:hypothetical protein